MLSCRQLPVRRGPLIDYNKVRVPLANNALGICEPVHVNCDPAAVHKHEVRVPDQTEMARAESLDEELFRMPPKTEHFAVTRPELLLVHCRCLTRARAHACARARTCASFSPVYVLSAALNVRLSTHTGARLRFRLLFTRLFLITFRRRSRLRFLRLLLRLLL